VVSVDLRWCYIGVHHGGLEGGAVYVLVVVILAFWCLPYALWGFFVGIGDAMLLSLVMFKWW